MRKSVELLRSNNLSVDLPCCPHILSVSSFLLHIASALFLPVFWEHTRDLVCLTVMFALGG